MSEAKYQILDDKDTLDKVASAIMQKMILDGFKDLCTKEKQEYSHARAAIAAIKDILTCKPRTRPPYV